MKVRIDEIKIIEKKRIRKDIGDLSSLMRSMSKYGLLQPIVLDRNYNLLAGYRRFIAAQQLGWGAIEAVIIDVNDKLSRLDVEIDENMVRKEFTYDEIDSAYEKREKFINPSFFQKICDFFKKIFFIGK
jgi:ParB family transcriptional regulator, chromosome partitioning protein